MNVYDLAVKDLLSLDSKRLLDIALTISKSESTGSHSIPYDRNLDLTANLSSLPKTRAYRFIADILCTVRGITDVVMSGSTFQACNFWRKAYNLKPMILRESKYKTISDCESVLKSIYKTTEDNAKLVSYFSNEDCTGLVLSSKYEDDFRGIKGITFSDTADLPSDSISSWLLTGLLNSHDNLSICMAFAFKMHGVSLKKKFVISADDSLRESIAKVKHISNALSQYFSFGDADSESVIFLHSLIYKKEAVYEPDRVQ